MQRATRTFRRAVRHACLVMAKPNEVKGIQHLSTCAAVGSGPDRCARTLVGPRLSCRRRRLPRRAFLQGRGGARRACKNARLREGFRRNRRPHARVNLRQHMSTRTFPRANT